VTVDSTSTRPGRNLALLVADLTRRVDATERHAGGGGGTVGPPGPAGPAGPPGADGINGTPILAGSGSPSNALGAVGDYYEDTASGILYGPKKATAAWEPEQRLTLAGAPTTNYPTGEWGLRIRFGRAGRITKIRYQRIAGTPTTMGLRVWSNAGAKLVDFSDTQTGTGVFEAALPTPLAVAANDVLVVSHGQSGGPPWKSSVLAVTNSADMTYVDLLLSGSANTFPTSPQPASGSYVDPVFEPSFYAWPESVRLVQAARTVVEVRRSVSLQTGTTLSLLASFENQMLTMQNASTITVTCPSNATASIPTGAEFDFMQLGVGQVVFVAGSGATLNGTPGLKARARYSKVTAKKIATDDWLVYGDLAA
jgi:Domain of unknown function (DUF4082)